MYSREEACGCSSRPNREWHIRGAVPSEHCSLNGSTALSCKQPTAMRPSNEQILRLSRQLVYPPRLRSRV